MIRSMTAFSRKEKKASWGELIWEIRSVNHRYLEIHPRLPEQLRDLENAVREQTKASLNRGKVEYTLKFKAESTTPTGFSLNKALIEQLFTASSEIQCLDIDSATLTTHQILTWPGVLDTETSDLSEVRKEALALLDAALTDLIDHRQREGTQLEALIESRLDAVLVQTNIAKHALPDILQSQRERILSKFDDIKANMDSDRLEQEMVLVAQKADIDEELDRLVTHVHEVKHTLKKGGNCGRRLDFLMQELNREANTLGSKSIHTVTTQVAVELKVLIEQMREQIQNIE